MLVGAAISAYQHFGLCRCDMPDEPGARHLERYREDLQLARRVGLEVFRTGIEWALLEPTEGRLDGDALALFQDYLGAIREAGLAAWITLHHFTNPRWVWRYGGWESPHVAKKFVNYVDEIARNLGKYIDLYLIFNEPNTYVYLAYIRGDIPPYGFLAYRHATRALAVIEGAILEARDLVKSYGGRASFPYAYNPAEARPLRPAAWLWNLRDRRFMGLFREMDYTAINHYVVARLEGITIRFRLKPQVLRRLRPPTPLIVTEFGIATRNEGLRRSYACTMGRVLRDVGAQAAVWWSLLHGYEWGLGYWPFFALIDENRGITPLARQLRDLLLNPPEGCGLDGELDLGLEWRWWLDRPP